MPELTKKPEKSERPSPSAYWQQRLTSWDPVFTPFSVISMLVIIGIVFLPVGVTMLFGANSLYTQAIQYGGVGTEASILTDCTDGLGCDLNFTIDMNIDGPLYLYYEISNYYQNNIKYSSSVNWNQMMGKTDVSQSDLGTSCDPATTTTDNANSALTLNPCGLIAKSYFTDAFSASVPSGTSNSFNQVEMSTDEITGPLDQSLFRQPDGFKSASYTGSACTSSTQTLTAAQCSADLGTPYCKCYLDAGKKYVFYYPDDDTTEYLYETYAGLVSPLEGVTDPRFMNWMNIAALPKFRKLYGKMEGTYKQGDQIKISVSYPVGIPGVPNSGTGYDVDQFKGTKSVVLSARGALGVKNRGLGVTYIVSGACMIVMALVFFVKHEVSPRPLGSAALLNWTR